MEETYKQESLNFSVTVKINAKREAYGEFTVRANDADTLKARHNEAKQLLLSNMF